ncbi:MAG: hypothetical protein R3C12_25075 [Planctomycetaceae bacterium]
MKSHMLSRSVLAVALLTVVFFQSTSSVRGESRNVADLVTAHLSAGEFQAALEIARSVPEEGERAVLLSQIAEQQIQAGDLTASQATLRQMPLNRTRIELAARPPRENR